MASSWGSIAPAAPFASLAPSRPPRRSRAAGGKILVSATVKDLVADAALRFSGRDLHALKG